MTWKLSRGQIRQLHELASMKEKGVLTADEFSRHKSLVLERNTGAPPPPRSRAPWLLAAVAALAMVGAAIVITSGGSAAHQPEGASTTVRLR